MPFLGLLALGFLAPQQKTLPPPVRPLPPYDAAWTKEPWIADEAPYLKIRREVEAYVLGRKVSQTKTDLVGQTTRMLTDWRANPKDSVVLYRAAYYAWMLAGLDYSPEAKTLLGARENYINMGAIPSPHSREYDRLRMLREGFLNEVFLNLGERLYKLNPDDREIALKLAWTNARYGPGSRKRAIEITTRLLKTGDPKRYPAIYYAYAEAHGIACTTEPKQEFEGHKKETFWGYRQYLASGPPWRYKAVEAQRHLDDFTKYLKDHGQSVPSS